MEGIIKYRCEMITGNKRFLSNEELTEINRCRNILKSKGLIGVLPDGIGFGNISIRYQSSNRFIVTGSQTGHLEELGYDDFALVEEAVPEENYLKCYGMTPASSESLSHSVFYPWSRELKGVVHIHSELLWEKYLNLLPTSATTAQYGTPEMAASLKAILDTADDKQKAIIVMGGHRDGIITGGFSLDEATSLITRLL